MKTINLRWMYPHYRHDEFVDVTDEVPFGYNIKLIGIILFLYATQKTELKSQKFFVKFIFCISVGD